MTEPAYSAIGEICDVENDLSIIVERDWVGSNPMGHVEMRLQRGSSYGAIGRRKGQVSGDGMVVSFHHYSAFDKEKNFKYTRSYTAYAHPIR